jgi:hypothetical protein
MWFFYLVAVLMSIVTCFLWVVYKRINWWEGLISIGLSFILAGGIHAIAIKGMTADTETWSGQITKVIHYPKWIEKYKVKVYKTERYTTWTGRGKKRRRVTKTRKVFSHYETRYRTHHEHWVENNNFGKEKVTKMITESRFKEIAQNFGGKIITTQPPKAGFYSGDRNVYTVNNETGYIYPSLITKTWENRIKAAPSTFSFAKIPEGIQVHPYPVHKHFHQSNRILGSARGFISILEWDKMCSRLGPVKKVNVILIGFAQQESQIAHYQEAKWIGGKKNDLVLCYGGYESGARASWAYVFGWTEEEIVKRNLETLLIQNPINNDLLPKIEEEIFKNYKIKEWKKFDYISIEPPLWSYIVMILIAVLCNGGFLYWAFVNKHKGQGLRE